MMFRYIDLFAGMGGLRLGLEQSLKDNGIIGECVLTSEVKPYAIKVYQDNFGKEEIKGDITKIEGKDIPDFDMLLAGFPCFSGDMLVYTIDGYKKISDIQIGMKVLTHKGRFCEVKEVMEKVVDDFYNLWVDKTIKIKVTENHPFYVKENKEDKSPKWIEVKDLKLGMYLAMPKEIVEQRGVHMLYGHANYIFDNNYYWFPLLKKPKKIHKKIHVFNLSVDLDNSYTVYSLAVHNCQPFSMAGKRCGFEDTRGTLFFEVARILKEKQPKYFLLENVENLVIHDLSKEDKKLGKTIGKTLETILNVLNDLGYKTTWKVIQASEYGVPQLRRRIYIVGSKDNYISLDNFEKKFKCFGDIQEKGLPCVDSDFSKRLFDYLDKNDLEVSFLYDKAIRDKRGSSNNIHSWDLGLRGDLNENQKEFLSQMVLERRKCSYAENKGLKYKEGIGLSLSDMQSFYKGSNFEKDITELLKLGYLKGKSVDYYNEILYDINGGRLSYEFTKILDPNKPCLTLVATDVGHLGVIDNNGIRKLTLREGLRLNGYPDSYKLDIDYNKGMDLLGNTVVVPVIKMICDRIVENERLDGCE